jgi:hypothetical protein
MTPARAWLRMLPQEIRDAMVGISIWAGGCAAIILGTPVIVHYVSRWWVWWLP